jgi:hypothetical protein
MISAHTDSDFFGIGNPKVSQLFGLVVLLVFKHHNRGYYEAQSWNHSERAARAPEVLVLGRG